ncbi:hypothetical protein SDRG_04432 [Saprolegnia diclina VS20]|uniref:Uncharacterized protein n=1 Tax=Saprolegnia diclina (strain VS20) TaxID=1156394 RepID=T0S5Q3_SAPDV|nr:hypothetical protein SDRG_04432 [Saprolegnia diclina VS20]EQC38002.1 hypothetical protein SDRG_04432 [Saprolegnia diclina VS20]|eukprot:XP_008608329.1 hypothetical protein SDRG_04432 [Saprolegnia diclina VS20]
MKRKADGYSSGEASPPRVRKEIECPGAPRKRKRQTIRKIPRLALVPQDDEVDAASEERVAVAVVRSLDDELAAAAAADAQENDSQRTVSDAMTASPPATPQPSKSPVSPSSMPSTPPRSPAADLPPPSPRPATPATESLPSTPMKPRTFQSTDRGADAAAHHISPPCGALQPTRTALSTVKDDVATRQGAVARRRLPR